MSLHAGIETLDFRFDGQHAVASFAPVLVGVVGSGNLEVLLEAGAAPACAVHVIPLTFGGHSVLCRLTRTSCPSSSSKLPSSSNSCQGGSFRNVPLVLPRSLTKTRPWSS